MTDQFVPWVEGPDDGELVWFCVRHLNNRRPASMEQADAIKRFLEAMDAPLWHSGWGAGKTMMVHGILSYLIEHEGGGWEESDVN